MQRRDICPSSHLVRRTNHSPPLRPLNRKTSVRTKILRRSYDCHEQRISDFLRILQVAEALWTCSGIFGTKCACKGPKDNYDVTNAPRETFPLTRNIFFPADFRNYTFSRCRLGLWHCLCMRLRLSLDRSPSTPPESVRSVSVCLSGPFLQVGQYMCVCPSVSVCAKSLHGTVSVLCVSMH